MVTIKPVQNKDAAPQVEWWDSFFLPAGKASFEADLPVSDKFFLDRVTHYVQHPVPLRNDQVEQTKQMTVPFYLTEKEKKKLRRKKRIEKEKEKQEKVSLGLAPAPLPRVTLKNYMKVMAKEAIQDPSKCEQKVRGLVEQRVTDHLDRNEANKLTSEQRELKMKRKHERDLDRENVMLVFKINTRELSAQNKFKIDMNAQQLHLQGLCLLADPHTCSGVPHIVVVEGGPTATKRYKKLMLNRIKWSEQTAPECMLVWEGSNPNPPQGQTQKKSWKLMDVRSEQEAKRILSERALGHLWSQILSFQ